MQVYRTPDERFDNLPDFPYEPRYHTLKSGLRLHYIDEGPRDGRPVLLLHGEPTWCYLWRHMIPLLVAQGFRVLAPDLIGFGRSDKVLGQASYSYAGQVAWIGEWVEALDLTNVTLGCQDWGSLIGLRVVADMPDRFAAIALSNGGLPDGQDAPRAFAIWRAFAKYSPVFPIGKIVKRGTKRPLSEAEVAAYDAPFPTKASKAAARAYPPLVPFKGNPAVPDQLRAWEVFRQWNKPFLCCFSDGDPSPGAAMPCGLNECPARKGCRTAPCTADISFRKMIRKALLPPSLPRRRLP